MKELFQAIMTYFNANSSSNFYSAINGNLYLHRVPAEDASGNDINYPYAVLFDISRLPDCWFDTERHEEVTLQFNLFDTSPESALNVLNYTDYLHDLFDDADIDSGLTNYRCLKFERELSNLLPEGEEQNLVWQTFTQYRVLLELK